MGAADSRTFTVAGHRGALSLAPENTLRSFRVAAEHGVTELELDLRLSADGEIVIMHDATVDRTTDGTGPVAELTVAQLQALDAGEGQPVPTWAAVVADTELPLQAELKSRDAVPPLVDRLRGDPALRARTAPTSFDEQIVGELAAALPDTVVGLICGTASVDVLDRAAALGARRVLLGATGADRALIETAHRRDLAVGLWPVRVAAELRRAVELGVDGVTVDDPRLLAQSGCRWRDGALVAD